jgi:hypothetical protein
MPNEKDIWKFLYEGFSLFPIKRKDKIEIIDKFYTSPPKSVLQKKKNLKKIIK